MYCMRLSIVAESGVIPCLKPKPHALTRGVQIKNQGLCDDNRKEDIGIGIATPLHTKQSAQVVTPHAQCRELIDTNGDVQPKQLFKQFPIIYRIPGF